MSKIVLVAIATFSLSCIASCRQAAKSNFLGSWEIHKVEANDSDRTEAGLASIVWAETLSGGATMDFYSNDSATIRFDQGSDQRHFHYSLDPDGRTILLYDVEQHRLDTLETKIVGDTLHIRDLTRNIRYAMTRGGSSAESF